MKRTREQQFRDIFLSSPSGDSGFGKFSGYHVPRFQPVKNPSSGSLPSRPLRFRFPCVCTRRFRCCSFSKTSLQTRSTSASSETLAWINETWESLFRVEHSLIIRDAAVSLRPTIYALGESVCLIKALRVASPIPDVPPTIGVISQCQELNTR